jgi:DNA repair photolyase
MSHKTTDQAPTHLRDLPRKGRGASLNLEGRFEAFRRQSVDDGWRACAETSEHDAPLTRTIVTAEIAKSIISVNDSPDIPFRYSVNPYRGCEHGCVYCFARPSHAYLGMSPGLDFETRLFAKTNAPQLLREELDRPSYRCEVISLGINTDAYQPIERGYRLTRQLLEIMHECQQPVALITKSSLIERDLDILADMAKKRLVHVTISITTQSHDISRYLEPRTSAPMRRFCTVRTLVDAGIPVGVNIAPVIPFLTDSELESLLETAAAHGATRAGYIVLRLPWELKPIFKDWLQAHFPLKAAHVMSRLAAFRSGRENDPRFGTRMTGEGIFAKLLSERFHKACKRHGLNKEGRRGIETLDTSLFVAPRLARQASLF